VDFGAGGIGEASSGNVSGLFVAGVGGRKGEGSVGRKIGSEVDELSADLERESVGGENERGEVGVDRQGAEDGAGWGDVRDFNAESGGDFGSAEKNGRGQGDFEWVDDGDEYGWDAGVGARGVEEVVNSLQRRFMLSTCSALMACWSPLAARSPRLV